MKVLLVFLIASFALSAKAQSSSIFKNKPWEDYKRKALLHDTLSRAFSIPNSMSGIKVQKAQDFEHNEKGVLHLPLKGTYAGKNGQGADIYVMQPDKMICLVPDEEFASNMPVAGFDNSTKNKLPFLKKSPKEDEK